ncbi:hypothetical protein M1M14_gp060 [Synechococcus phage ACG-2014e]|jgi:hypothetical protein|uniref:Uncharacterized protein n=1 Tax=Synechococcus phage ACG-2014e TaxID=1493510 RepID=A0A0E3FMT9_9CAUD|nr:hypothetical protein AAJ58_gp059 [Synechococcus phage ACG-2014e]YP_010355672.1 hypothetical protein M1M14_gp060 [Synechococcus phage ACG-2014e]AIX20523.1 hypothetical protein Syn7803C85_60 [Synechococcus phage ACG-2014e]AIX29739.1 hypothetical protein Syn7803US33_58 [Synechococcus phage ACG-2014e]AIX44978.1 hypothetical protein Syn7803C2_59 [Synechococcus phage ACG-2014e]
MDDYTITDEMRDLIVQYMTACNEQRYADSEQLLEQIKAQGQTDYDNDPRSNT